MRQRRGGFVRRFFEFLTFAFILDSPLCVHHLGIKLNSHYRRHLTAHALVVRQNFTPRRPRLSKEREAIKTSLRIAFERH